MSLLNDSLTNRKTLEASETLETVRFSLSDLAKNLSHFVGTTADMFICRCGFTTLVLFNMFIRPLFTVFIKSSRQKRLWQFKKKKNHAGFLFAVSFVLQRPSERIARVPRGFETPSYFSLTRTIYTFDEIWALRLISSGNNIVTINIRIGCRRGVHYRALLVGTSPPPPRPALPRFYYRPVY